MRDKQQQQQQQMFSKLFCTRVDVVFDKREKYLKREYGVKKLNKTYSKKALKFIRTIERRSRF